MDLRKDLRILWPTIDRSPRVVHHFDSFREEVSKRAEVVTLMKSTEPYLAGQYSKKVFAGQHIPEKLFTKNLAKEDFDFVFTDAFFAYEGEDWELFSCGKGMLIEDVHREIPKWQIDTAKLKGIKTIFHRFYDAFFNLHPGVDKDYYCFWLPHGFDTELFRDYGEEKSGVYHLGMYNYFYPHRERVIKLLKNFPGFKLIPRPGETLDFSPKWPVGEDYARLVNSAKICVTGGSMFGAPVQKYFEIPACRTALMTNWFGDLDRLGFERDVSLIEYEQDIPMQVIRLLEDDVKIKEVADCGYQLVNRNHTVQKRAEEFLDMLEVIIDRG